MSGGLDRRVWRRRRAEVTAQTEASSPEPPEGMSRAEWLSSLGYVAAPEPPEMTLREKVHERENYWWRGWHEHGRRDERDRDS